MTDADVQSENLMRDQFRRLWAAFDFLTVLPTPLRGVVTTDDMARSAVYFPVVGLWLGLLLVGADSLLARLFRPTLQAALTLTFWIALTGALHLDGFIDCCDALFFPASPERRLAILRDVHVGAFGLVGAALLLLVKFSALLDLPLGQRAEALLLAPTLARGALPYTIWRYPYARSGAGLGRSFRQALSWPQVILAATVAALPAGIVGGWHGLVALAVTWLVVAVLAWWAQRCIPGLTGDVYGAITEALEISTLLVFCVI